MQRQVRVRRERPSALSWALALAATMLAVYLITLSAPASEPSESVSSGPRVTSEINLAGIHIYFADLGVYPDASQARIAASALSQQGAAGVVTGQSDGYHVLGAGYALEADAARIAKQLTDRESLSASVLEFSAPEVSLRVTAQEAHAAAISEADRTLRSQLDQAASMALQVDRGELPSASARTLAQVSRSELTRTRKALEKVPGAAEHPVCTGLITQLDLLAEELDALARSGCTGAELSGRLRCCHVSGTLRLIDYLNMLSSSNQ